MGVPASTSTHHSPKSLQGSSSIGRALVSKTRCWGFESLLPCHFSAMKNPFRKIRIFYNETLNELKKSSWPDRKELKDSTIVVIIAVALLGGYVSLVDFSLFQVVSLFTDLIRG